MRRRLPQNVYGLVTGVEEGAAAALCTWLAERTESIAGLDVGKTPLTFGMLWNPAGGPGRNGLENPVEDPRVNLTMMTTSVVEGRPYLFPMRTSRYRFRPSELERFFPKHVVAGWWSTPARATQRRTKSTASRWSRCPPIGDLPILVATRMSLAFPVLLSAVPLY